MKNSEIINKIKSIGIPDFDIIDDNKIKIKTIRDDSFITLEKSLSNGRFWMKWKFYLKNECIRRCDLLNGEIEFEPSLQIFNLLKELPEKDKSFVQNNPLHQWEATLNILVNLGKEL